MKSLFCQFWTDILEFGGQLAIYDSHFNENS